MANVWLKVRGRCFAKPFKRIGESGKQNREAYTVPLLVKARVREPLGHNLQVRRREVTNA